MEAKMSFVSLFINEIEENEIPLLENSIKNQEVEVLRYKAHSLKSNVRFFGYDGLSSEFEKIEDELTRSNEFTEGLLQKMDQSIFKLRTACSQLRNWRAQQA